MSASTLYSEFLIGTGFLLPEESASPNSIFVTSTASTLSLPINLFGLDSQRKSIPSSMALLTSLAEPGIFSLSLLYKHFTDFAFCLIAVRTQSIAVSPPPITTIFLFSAFKVPSSNNLTLSPKPFRFEAVRKSIAGKIFFRFFPSISTSLALYTPVAISIASCFDFNSSKVASLPTSKLCLNLIPESFKSFVLRSTTNFSSLKFGIPYISNPPGLSYRS